ncbi:hypothetical protein CE164_05160 [Bifidobacterium breve]|nr:hypothetical protein CE164_05160 [Bifidobacterium breve]
MPVLPYLFDAALSFNNKQSSPRGQRFTSKPAGFGCRHSTENLKHYKNLVIPVMMFRIACDVES